MLKRILPYLLIFGLASGCRAGWLSPTQPGYVIQTFTTYQPITGINTGTILTNGISFQFAGNNAGFISIGGPGVQFRGVNAGSVTVDGDGAFVLGNFAGLSSATNHGKGSLILGNLTAGQRATITDVGNASILIGAGTVSNNQAVVVGDGNVSHGARSITADSFWATGAGFIGNGAGLTNLPPDPRTNTWNSATGAVQRAGDTMSGQLRVVSPAGSVATFGSRRPYLSPMPGWVVEGGFDDGMRLMPVIYNNATTFLFTVTSVDEGNGYAHPRLTFYRTLQGGYTVAAGAVEIVASGVVGQSILSLPPVRIGGDLDITGRTGLSNFVQSVINAQ